MPIIGRTTPKTENAIGKLQVVGRLWKGAPKGTNSAGKDLLDKFRFEAPDPIREKFEEFYGDSMPKEVRIFLPYASTDEVFETWNESYTAQGFQHRCNGENIIQEMQPCKIAGKTKWQKVDVEKPCLRGDAPTCDRCTANGRFFFYIQELYRSGMGSTKCFMMTVTGTHDIIGFTEQLRGLEAKYGCLHASPIPSPWTHGYIPYVLTRIERSISRPNGEARAKGKAWVLSISEDPEWLEMMQRWAQAQELMRLKDNPEVKRLLLPNLHINRNAPQLPGSTIEAEIIPEPETAITPPMDNHRIVIYQEIASLMKRMEWKKTDGREYLQQRYQKSTRDELDDEQLIEFRDDLVAFVAAKESEARSKAPAPESPEELAEFDAALSGGK